MNKLPKARNKNILVQELDGEVLIYDTISDKAYCLNETCGAVFNACDGKQSFDDLKRASKFTDDLIYLALDELKNKNLLGDDKSYQSPFARMTRREVIRKVGLASMIALPIISSIIAPSAIHAASGTVARGGVCSITAGSTPCAVNNSCRTTNENIRRCCASTNTVQPQSPGTPLGGTTPQICTGTIGPQYCCSGSATNGAQCVCDPYPV